jgi:RNA polymerase sigma factor (sigma-70 family)
MDPVTKVGLVEYLCREYEGQLIRYLANMLGNPELARELAQEAFAKMHTAYSSEFVRFPRAALFRIATNLALMEIRRRRVERRLLGQSVGMEHMQEVPDEDASPPEQRVFVEEISAHIAETIKELRPNLRSVFVLAHVQGKPRREIAAALGVSEKRVDKRMTKALKECRERLASRGVELADALMD